MFEEYTKKLLLHIEKLILETEIVGDYTGRCNDSSESFWQSDAEATLNSAACTIKKLDPVQLIKEITDQIQKEAIQQHTDKLIKNKTSVCDFPWCTICYGPNPTISGV